ncbi:MAG: AI-2E family transporter [Caldimonas sp.]
MKTETARTVAVLFIFAACLYLLRGLLAPICWAALIAIATWPLHERLLRLLGHGRHGVSAAVFTAATVLLIVVPFAWLVVRGLHELPSAIQVWATSRESGLPAPDWLGGLPLAGPWLVEQWQATLGQPGALSDYAHGFFSDLNFHTGRALVVLVGHRAMALFFCILILFFLYLSGSRIVTQIDVVLERQFGPSGITTKRLTVQAIRGTVNGLILVGLGLAVLMSIAYAIAGVRHAALWGLATGLLGIVPFGAMAALAGVVLYLMALGANTAAVAVLVFGTVAIFITDHFIRPLLITGALRLPLVLALMGIVAGLETFGILGIFIGPTLLAVMLTLWRQLAATPPPSEG